MEEYPGSSSRNVLLHTPNVETLQNSCMKRDCGEELYTSHTGLRKMFPSMRLLMVVGEVYLIFLGATL